MTELGTWAVQLLGIPAAFLYANASEWVTHKYVLHGLGRSKRSYWSFHWHEHHRLARRNGHIDPHYERSVFHWNAKAKEALGLALSGVLYFPLLFVWPLFYLTLVYTGVNYYYVHKKAHQDPDWARRHLPWHYDHHMGPNQDANWCVTRPWFDNWLGTRDPYVGTEREAQDLALARAKRARAAVQQPGWAPAREVEPGQEEAASALTGSQAA